MKTVKEFWMATRPNGDCMEWTRSVKDSVHPYGRVWWMGRKVAAHRLAWTIARGVIPAGMHVLHRCDNPRCVNPAHLFLGTHQSNMDDMMSKGRNKQVAGESWHLAHDASIPRGVRRTSDQIRRGVENPTSKLTELQVLRIKLAYKHNRTTRGLGVLLAAELGVHQSTVVKVGRGINWKHYAAP